jgi:hypothetical protein
MHRVQVCRGNRLFVVICIVLLGGATMACGLTSPADSESGSATPSAQSVAPDLVAIYQQLAETLNQPGVLYHATIERHETTMDSTGSRTEVASITELWVDSAQPAARLHRQRGDSILDEIVTPEGAFLSTSDGNLSRGEAPNCPSTTLPVAVVLTCPDAPFETVVFGTPESSPQVVTATPDISSTDSQVDGRPAVTLTIQTQRQPWRSNPIDATRTLSVDQATGLPLAEQVEQHTGDETTTERATWSSEFVSDGSVATGFFDPITLADARPDPEPALDVPPLGYTLYWLGTRFNGTGLLPDLELTRVSRYNPGDGSWPADQVLLEYGEPAQPFVDAPVLRIFEYSREVWDRIPKETHGPDGPCWSTDEIVLADGHATLFEGFTWPGDVPPDPDDPDACPSDREHDRFFVQAFLSETVVVIDVPFDSPAKLEAALKALKPR